MLPLNDKAGFGIYVHWPFCLSKCPYCDFNSHAAQSIDQERWRTALLRELDWFARLTPGRRVTSIFFGGGTPSLMDPATAAAIIARVHRSWPGDPDLEITLEANPSAAENRHLADFAAAGINRLSLGVQALNAADLAFLGRRHDVAEARAALENAARLFPRFSFDLIYARPGQTIAAWRAELAQALDLAGDHLSLYQLTIEAGTAFYPAHERGEFRLPDDDTAAELFALTQDMTTAVGLPAYEVSNHARPGSESRHNLTYWRGGDYVGIGPGAHGRLSMTATRQHRAPDIWLRRVEKDGHATQESDTLDPLTRAQELVMMGLRLAEGVDIAHFPQQCGLALDQVVNLAERDHLVRDGFLATQGDRLRVTASGRLVLNALTARLLA